jgi:gamma-glutamylcyclotransferase (GGCT)/AIG2-like uncharacterized protein YtfP
MNDFIFVYGTLMRKFTGYKPIDLEQHGKYVCEGFVHGRLYEIDNYPGLILSENPIEKVYGEIYQLIDFNSAIKILDEYEDYFPENPQSSLYVRQIENIVVDTKDVLKKAWVYIYKDAVEEERRIATGNYLDYIL